MRNLKRNSFLSGLIVIHLLGCSTSSYRVVKQRGMRTELRVTSDRILLECEKASDENDLYGFMMHVLDDENTVMTVLQGNMLDKESCFDRVREIGAILQKGKKIYIGGMGELASPRRKEEYAYFYKGKGTFHDNGRVLQFSAIANEYGDCYGAHYGTEKPCPRDEFPLN